MRKMSSLVGLMAECRGLTAREARPGRLTVDHWTQFRKKIPARG
jgi:hypothetical protein